MEQLVRIKTYLAKFTKKTMLQNLGIKYLARDGIIVTWNCSERVRGSVVERRPDKTKADSSILSAPTHYS